MKNKIIEVFDYLKELQNALDALDVVSVSNLKIELSVDPFEDYGLWISYKVGDNYDDDDFIYFNLSEMKYINYSIKNETWKSVMTIMNKKFGEFEEAME